MGSKATWGTASIINPILALTSAQNVYSHRQRTFATLNLRLYNKEQTMVEVARIFLPDAFVQGDLTEDYALLVLHDPVTQCGYYGLKVLAEPLPGMFINMLAFPIPHKQEVRDFKQTMQFERGIIEEVDR